MSNSANEPSPFFPIHAFHAIHPSAFRPRPHFDEDKLDPFLARSVFSLLFENQINLSHFATVIAGFQQAIETREKPLFREPFRARTQFSAIRDHVEQMSKCRAYALITAATGPKDLRCISLAPCSLNERKWSGVGYPL